MTKIASCCLVLALAVVCGGQIAAGEDKVDKKAKSSQEQKFKAKDKNGDGKLTLAEFVGMNEGEGKEKAEKAFKRADKNHDGVVSLEEFVAAHAKKGPNKGKKK